MVNETRKSLGLEGCAFDHDRLWRIEGPNFIAGLTEYNDELTSYAPILKGVFGSKAVHYGGNAYYILKEARRRGYKVEHIEDRR